jgi:DNA modification methylase
MTIVREETIGDCRLIQADAQEVLPTLNGLDAVVTDPPYGMAFRSNYRKVRHQALQNDDCQTALTWACELEPRHSGYVFARWDAIRDVPAPRSCITWIKNNWSMGDLQHEHARQTEAILFYPGPKHDFPAGRPTDVLDARRTDNSLHPTQKPVALMRAVVRWTRGTVCDPFMGSGTTGVACAKLGRKFIGVEIDPRYFDIACERIREAYRQPDMFTQPAASKAEQMDIDGLK